MVFNYSGLTVTDVPEGNMPSLLNTSYTMTADIEVPASGAVSRRERSAGPAIGPDFPRS